MCVGCRVHFHPRRPAPRTQSELTTNYPRLIDELDPGDRILLADGTVGMCVLEKSQQQSTMPCICTGHAAKPPRCQSATGQIERAFDYRR